VGGERPTCPSRSPRVPLRKWHGVSSRSGIRLHTYARPERISENVSGRPGFLRMYGAREESMLGRSEGWCVCDCCRRDMPCNYLRPFTAVSGLVAKFCAECIEDFKGVSAASPRPSWSLDDIKEAISKLRAGRPS
jgi:hypothetical protein